MWARQPRHGQSAPHGTVTVRWKKQLFLPEFACGTVCEYNAYAFGTVLAAS